MSTISISTSPVHSVVRTQTTQLTEATTFASTLPSLALPAERTQASTQPSLFGGTKKDTALDTTLQSIESRSVPKASLSKLLGDKTRSRRVVYVRRQKSTYTKKPADTPDLTLKGEREFLDEIERNRNKRLEKICICPVTRKLLFKEWRHRTAASLGRFFRGCNVLCCPPFCNTLPRIAFWPPQPEYFFFREPDGMAPLKFGDSIGVEEAKMMAERKKKLIKLKKANKASMDVSWKLGMVHPCADDINEAEAFVVVTKRKNYLGCVRIKCRNPRFYILYSHPNGSDISDHLTGIPNMIDMARFYRCEIYSYDYSGYGISSGSPSEKNQNADIQAVYQHMLDVRKIEPSRIVLIGYSIGTSASVHLVASMQLKVAGVILQAPLTSIFRVFLWGRGCFNQPYKDKSCCADRFSLFDKIGEVSVPVLVIHGLEDSTVPITHGEVINQRAANKVPPLWLSATHDDLENCRQVWMRIRQFLKSELRPPKKSCDLKKKFKKMKL